MKKNIIITAIVVVVAIIALIVINKVTSKEDLTNLFVEAEKGQFDIIISTTGELEAEKSVDIVGPEIAMSRNIRAADIEITDMVPEGTEVKEGDYVATLDRTSFDNTYKDELEELTSLQSELELKILDTAVTLSALRETVRTNDIAVEEAQITLEESKYEPPTTIRTAEIDLLKAKRALIQSKKNYELKVEEAKSELKTIKVNLADQRETVADLQEVLTKFVVKAPSSGMIIYKRGRDGSKRKVGSSISPWDKVVATLPDMTAMISKTYVNEIDVSKVKPAQKVDIVIDAFPNKRYTGKVTSVANIGEQLPNADAKVFEVLVKIDGSDPILRPSMTTGNQVITNSISDVIYIPLECVQTGSDSIPFVYMKNGTRRVVVLGETNETSAIITQGLEEGEQLYLNTPEEPEKFKMTGTELISVIKEQKRLKAEAEQKALKEAEEKAKMQEMNGMGMPGGGFPGGGMPGGVPNGSMPSGMRPGAGGPGGQGGTRDTAMMRKMMQMRKQQGGATRGQGQVQGQTPAQVPTGQQQ